MGHVLDQFLSFSLSLFLALYLFHSVPHSSLHFHSLSAREFIVNKNKTYSHINANYILCFPSVQYKIDSDLQDNSFQYPEKKPKVKVVGK